MSSDVIAIMIFALPESRQGIDCQRADRHGDHGGTNSFCELQLLDKRISDFYSGVCYPMFEILCSVFKIAGQNHVVLRSLVQVDKRDVGKIIGTGGPYFVAVKRK